MANIITNLLNTVIAPADVTTVQTALNTINTTLNPILRALTEEERENLLSMNVNNKVFVEEALQEIDAHTAILPAAISGANLQNDLDLFNQLDSFESELKNLLGKVQDTKRLAGHEAYAMGLTGYTIFKALAASGVEDARQAAERLGERFMNNGGQPQPEV